MKSLYIKEYDNTGKLIFIVDKKTGRGFRLKHQLPLSELDDFIENIEREEKNQRDLSKSWINRLVSFQNEISPSSLTKVLVILYGIFLISLAFYIFFYGLVLNKIGIVYTKEGLIHSLIGLGIFIVGIVFIHEFSHIMTARLQGIYIKKVGFRIRYFIFPVFFVRIFPTSIREKKMNVAFAGLVADLFLLHLYNAIYLMSNLNSFRMALAYQLVMSIYNYNILLPTDFSNSLLQFINRGNFRVEAFEYSKRLFLRKNSTDNFYHFLSKKKKITYITYTFLFSVLWVAIAIGIVYQFIKSSQMG